MFYISMAPKDKFWIYQDTERKNVPFHPPAGEAGVSGAKVKVIVEG
jgi:hypothetical protein